MRIAVVMMVRDEADIIVKCLNHWKLLGLVISTFAIMAAWIALCFHYWLLWAGRGATSHYPQAIKPIGQAVM